MTSLTKNSNPIAKKCFCFHCRRKDLLNLLRVWTALWHNCQRRYSRANCILTLALYGQEYREKNRILRFCSCLLASTRKTKPSILCCRLKVWAFFCLFHVLLVSSDFGQSNRKWYIASVRTNAKGQCLNTAKICCAHSAVGDRGESAPPKVLVW